MVFAVASVVVLLLLAGALGAPTPPGACPGLSLISRAQWGAAPPKQPPTPLPVTPPFVIVHHTATATCQNRSACDSLVRGIQRFHQVTRGWDDIGYQFLVAPSGDVYEGRGWGVVGAQAGDHFFNFHSIGVSFIGNYEANPLPTPDRMWPAFLRLVRCGQSERRLTANITLKGHRDVRPEPTLCPGRYLYALVRKDPRYRPGPRNYTSSTLYFRPRVQ